MKSDCWKARIRPARTSPTNPRDHFVNHQVRYNMASILQHQYNPDLHQTEEMV
jgi:hypothetical protein